MITYRLHYFGVVIGTLGIGNHQHILKMSAESYESDSNQSALQSDIVDYPQLYCLSRSLSTRWPDEVGKGVLEREQVVACLETSSFVQACLSYEGLLYSPLSLA